MTRPSSDTCRARSPDFFAASISAVATSCDTIRRMSNGSLTASMGMPSGMGTFFAGDATAPPPAPAPAPPPAPARAADRAVERAAGRAGAEREGPGDDLTALRPPDDAATPPYPSTTNSLRATSVISGVASGVRSSRVTFIMPLFVGVRAAPPRPSTFVLDRSSRPAERCTLECASSWFKANFALPRLSSERNMPPLRNTSTHTRLRVNVLFWRCRAA